MDQTFDDKIYTPTRNITKIFKISLKELVNSGIHGSRSDQYRRDSQLTK